MARVTLSYRASAGLQSPARFAADVGAIELFQGELLQLGLDVVSDETVPSDRAAVRTIVLETNALGESLWCDDAALKYATRNLYTQALQLRIPGPVRAAEPEVSP